MIAFTLFLFKNEACPTITQCANPFQVAAKVVLNQNTTASQRKEDQVTFTTTVDRETIS